MEAREETVPFRHWLAGDLIDESILADVLAELPPPDSELWVRYANDSEHKRTSRDILRIGPATVQLFARLCHIGFVQELRELTGIAGLQSDPTLHGAGVHITDAGGWLAPHLDYAAHPAFPGLERRLNLVLFLTPRWSPAWGGAFELCNDMGHPAKRIWPQWGRSVLWEAGDLAYHGTEQTVPIAPLRVTVACYYLAPARPGCVRKRALFVPRRDVA